MVPHVFSGSRQEPIYLNVRKRFWVLHGKTVQFFFSTVANDSEHFCERQAAGSTNHPADQRSGWPVAAARLAAVSSVCGLKTPTGMRSSLSIF